MKSWWRWFRDEVGSWWMATIVLGTLLLASGTCLWAAKRALTGLPLHDAMEIHQKKSP